MTRINFHIASQQTSKRFVSFALIGAFLFLSACELPKIPTLRSPFEPRPEVEEIPKERPEPLFEEAPFDTTVPDKALFSAPVRNDKDRFRRLEGELQKLRNEFDSVQPSIKRLSGIESELTDLMKQIESSLSYPQKPYAGPAQNQFPPVDAIDFPVPEPTAMAKPQPVTPSVMQTAPVAKPMAKNNNFKVPAPMATTGQLLNIRVADSAGKARIVIETSKSYRPSVNINGSSLVVTYPDGRADLDVASIPVKSKKVRSISKSNNPNGGFTLTFALQPDCGLMTQGFIKPNKDSPNYRHFIDISR